MNSKVNLLVLDDDHEDLSFMQDALDRIGLHNYRLFQREDRFLESLTDDVDCTVIDHILNGEIRGFEIVGEIVKINKIRPPLLQCSIIVVSGQKNEDVIQQYLNDGNVLSYYAKNEDSYLNKVVASIKKAIARAQMTREFLNGQMKSIDNLSKLGGKYEFK